MSVKPSLQRRRYFIDKTFQTRFIVTFLLVLVFGGCLSVAMTWLGWFGGADTLTSMYDNGGLVIRKTSLAILPSVILTTLVTTCVLGLVVWVVTLLVSHKIAGPMYRFEHDLRAIAEGDLQKSIRIRDGDQFAAMAGSLNVMVGSFKEKLAKLDSELERLAGQAKDMNSSPTLIDGIEECRRTLRDEFRL
ncbi:MAG: methyl-accepting chemotaxis protein [Desulfobulbaceae bacterium]|jgi:methyl-accepting chemotaxis protein|nr:methyl-accepting chemotaxis protein [Desulfobulbaceae bacterium]